MHGLAGEEGLMGGDDDVRHHQQQGQLVVVNHLVGAVLVEVVGFLLVHVEGGRAYLMDLLILHLLFKIVYVLMTIPE